MSFNTDNLLDGLSTAFSRSGITVEEAGKALREFNRLYQGLKHFDYVRPEDPEEAAMDLSKELRE